MSATTNPLPPAVEALRRREVATEASIQAIDQKVSALALAKKVRVAALTNVRSEISRQILAGSFAPDPDHERA